MYKIFTYNGTACLSEQTFEEYWEAEEAFYEAQDEYLKDYEHGTDEHYEQYEIYQANSRIEEMK